MLSVIRMFVNIHNQRFLLIISGLVALLLIFQETNILIYGLSYLFHILTLEAFLFRNIDHKIFKREAFLFRSLAFTMLIALYLPFVGTPLNYWAVVLFVTGLGLQLISIRALGWDRTYYGVELGVLKLKKITKFPYNDILHPMLLGVFIQFAGLYFLSPAFNERYPYLILGHLIFTLVIILVEHFDFHFKKYFFTAQKGTLFDEKEQQNIDKLKEWSLDHFKDYLHRDSSMHRYVKTLPPDVIKLIDTLRYSDAILSLIKTAFPNSTVVPLSMTDELYISRYNYDRGGDQGLFDKHYDGNLRFIPGMSVVRSLIYLSSDDHLEVVFDTSGKKVNMKTYDFGLLDFHKEHHWVEGSYLPTNPSRILLKCNYYVNNGEGAISQKIRVGLNVFIFYLVKAAMEYSKSPKTVPQRIVGFFCNLFRRLNNVSPALPSLLVLVTLFMSIKVIL